MARYSTSSSSRSDVKRLAVAVIACAAAFGVPEARADADLDEQLSQAATLESVGDPAGALSVYRRVAMEHSGERLVRRAQARIEWLEARNEGSFAPLADLTRERSRQSAAPDSAALAAFAMRTAQFPEGRVRREAWQLIADTSLHRFDEAAEALHAYETWLREPGIDRAERELAQSGAALARTRLGDTGQALASLDDAGLRDRAEARFLRASRVGAIGSRFAWAIIGAHLGLLAWTGLRQRRGIRPVRALGTVEALLGVTTLGLPALLVRRYDPQLVVRFDPVMTASAAALAFAWMASSWIQPSPTWRRATAITSALSVVAAAWLASVHSGMLTELLMAAWEPR